MEGLMTDERINAMFAVALDLMNANLALTDAVYEQQVAARASKDLYKISHMDRAYENRQQAYRYVEHARDHARRLGIIPPADDNNELEGTL